MLIIPGYSILECIRETARSAVYVGRRVSDGRAVVLKVYRSSDEQLPRRAERELELLQRIESERVVRPVEVCASGEGTALIVERFAGHPLSRCAKGAGLGTADFLAIALETARALASVHDARVIHKDIKPDNVLFDPERMRICLIDFGISAEFGRAEHSTPPALAEGTLCYIAPEQTGRTGRGVDFRTDLYSLGATLYELLTGAPPFDTVSGLDLVLAHLTLCPRTAAQVDPRIPIPLSRIVAKLLEKDPELRYQTARGLAADLELCRKQLEAAGEIDPDLVLGTADASDRLRFANKMYGREQESVMLQETLERVRRGSVECVLLSGPAGIGKSTLSSVLRGPIARMSGYFAEAKFDTDRRERPYAGLSTVLSSIVDQLLIESDARSSKWRERIRARVGGIGAALLDLAPNLQDLIDDFPSVPPLGAQQERERLTLAVTRFVRTLARSAHPLVFFFDDLQWADEGSSSLLAALLRDTEIEALLVLGGYRDNEVAADHPILGLRDTSTGIPNRMHTLAIGPLRLADTNAMLAEALGRSAAQTEWLAHLIGSKCRHNPLLVRRIMFHLWDHDLIRYEHGSGWVWDELRIGEAEIPDDAAAMVAERIDALPDATRELAKIASLIGTVFDVDMLAELSGCDRLDVHQRVMGLVDQGLIAPCRDGFKFLHDRIREAAQSRMQSAERAKLHRCAARLLIERASVEGRSSAAFAIAEHLSESIEQLDESERREALDIFHLAGKTGLGKGAHDTAARYLNLAQELVHESDWRERPELAFAIYIDAAEAALQQRSYERAAEVLDSLERRPLVKLQVAKVAAKRIVLHSLRAAGDPVDHVIEALAKLGVRWPRRPSDLRMWLEIQWTDWKLRGPIDGRMFPGAPSSEIGWMAPVIVTSAAAPRLTLYSARLACMGWALALRSFRAHFTVVSPSMALAGYAGLCIAVRGNLASAERYARAITYWIEATDSAVESMRARMVLEALIHSWIRPRRSMLEPLTRVAELASELGDRQFVSFSLHCAASIAALSGEALPRVSERMAELVAREIGATRQTAPTMARAYALLHVHGLDWEAECEALVALSRDADPAEHLYGLLHVIVVLVLAARFAQAAELTDRLWSRYLTSGGLGSRLADLHLYRGLAHAALAEREARSRSRWRHQRVVRECARKLRSFARHGPDFEHMRALLDAEVARLRGRMTTANRQYQLAAQAARSAGYTQHAALCHERRADVLLRQRRHIEARSALASAITLYRAWGAVAKAEQLVP